MIVTRDWQQVGFLTFLLSESRYIHFRDTSYKVNEMLMEFYNCTQSLLGYINPTPSSPSSVFKATSFQGKNYINLK